MEWFEKLKEGLEYRGFVQPQVGPYMYYREDVVILFYVYGCLTFIPSEDKIDYVYTSLRENFKIEDDGDINKYLEIELDF